jgi:hypothetical protein
MLAGVKAVYEIQAVKGANGSATIVKNQNEATILVRGNVITRLASWLSNKSKKSEVSK